MHEILLILPQFLFLIEIQVFLQLSLRGLSWATEAFLHFQYYDLQEAFLSKTTSILTETRYSRHSCL
jgi:hypothetical protein